MMAWLWVSLPAPMTKLMDGLYFHKMGSQIIYAGSMKQRMAKMSHFAWGKQNLFLPRKCNLIMNGEVSVL